MGSGTVRKPRILRIVIGAVVGISIGATAYIVWREDQPDPIVRQIAERENVKPKRLQESYDLLDKAAVGALSNSDWLTLVGNADSPDLIIRHHAYSAIADQWDTARGSQVLTLLEKMRTDKDRDIRDEYIWRKALARAPGWESEAEVLLDNGNENERMYAKDALAIREKLQTQDR